MSRSVLARAGALVFAASLCVACVHHEPPSVDASPAAEATAALGSPAPFPAPSGGATPAAASSLDAGLEAGSVLATGATADVPDAAEETDPSDPSLPQTHERPKADDPALAARIDALWAAIVADDPHLADSAFFPLAAYQQVKAITNPASDWNHRLMAAFAEDIHALHKRLGARADQAKLVGLELPDARARWVDPGEEYNKIGYYRVFGTVVRYHLDRATVNGAEVAPHDDSFVIASLISWRGQWYIVHLTAVR